MEHLPLFIALLIRAGLIVVVGYMASSRNRQINGWVIIALVISPIVVIVIMLCIGKRNNRELPPNKH